MRTQLAIATLAMIVLSANGAEQLSNGGFESVGPNGSVVEWTGASGGGNSAAQDWLIFHNTQGTTLTELVPTTAPGNSGDFMLHVQTDGHANGVEQVMLPTNTGPHRVVSEAWVYVISGKVTLGVGNGGNTGSNAISTTTGQWELIRAQNVQCPANLAIIYAWTGAAEFYVDLASVQDVPTDIDIDGNGAVDIEDLLFMLSQWGPCSPCCVSDVNLDGQVDIIDLLQLLANWT